MREVRKPRVSGGAWGESPTFPTYPASRRTSMKIGLTGSIACGKSTVSQYLRQKGCFIVDADAISRALTADGGAALPRNPPGVRRRRVFRRVARPRKARPARLCRRAEARNAQRHSPPDDPFGNQASARPPRRAGANRRRRRSAAVRVRNGIHVRYRLGRPSGAGNADSAPFRARRAEPRARPSAALIRRCRRMKRSAAQTPSLIPTVPSSRRTDRWMRCWRPPFPARGSAQTAAAAPSSFRRRFAGKAAHPAARRPHPDD